MDPDAVDNFEMCVVQDVNEGTNEINETVEDENSTVVNQSGAYLGNRLIEVIELRGNSHSPNKEPAC